MNKHLHYTMLAAVMSVLLFSSCSDDDTIVVFDEIQQTPPLGDSNGNINDMIEPLEYNMTFPYGLKDRLGYKITSFYPLEGEGSVTLKQRIYPFYVYDDSNGHGDYYIVQSEVSVNSGDMYRGLLENIYTEEDKGIKSNIRLCGYYLKSIDVTYELLDRDNNVVGTFPISQGPTPLTTIGSTTYTSGFKFGISGRIRVGIAPKDSVKLSSIDLRPVKADISYVNKAERNKEDLDVYNNSTDNAVRHIFKFTKEPAAHAAPDVYIPDEPALMAVSTTTHSQEWIWRVSETHDCEGEDVHYRIRQKVSLEYGATKSQHSNVGHGLRYGLEEKTYTVNKESIFDVTPPCRMPMGKIKIVNKNRNMYIKNVRIFKEGAMNPSAVSRGSIAYEGGFERTLDIGRYMVYFEMGHNNSDIRKYVSEQMISVSKDNALVLYSDFDFEPADM